MGLKKIKFGDKEFNKKDFYSSEQAIPLYSVDVDKVVVSNKLEINETTWKSICGYSNNSLETIQPLCVILPQMNGYIKYFDNGNKNMSFVTEDEKIYNKYNEIWEVIRKLLKVKYAADPIQDGKYIVAKLKIFDKVNKTIFNNYTVKPTSETSSLEHIKKRDYNSISLEKHTYNCIAAINIDSVLKIDTAKSEATTNNKKAYPQAYLEQCKYKLKKEKVVNFVDDEIIDDGDDDNDDDVDSHLNF